MTTHKNTKLHRLLVLSAPYIFSIYSGSLFADVTITAPLFPIVYPDGLYNYEGDNYPADQQTKIDIANKYHKTYETLLAECSALVDGIHLGNDLTDAQTLSNYHLVAECSYEHFGSKPYYIPQLVNDVDLCAERFGPSYRMISESDIAGFSDTFYSELNNVLITANSSGSNFAGFYFSLSTFIRGNNGTLKIGDLHSNTTSNRISEIQGDWKQHQESSPNGSPVVLRCLLNQ